MTTESWRQTQRELIVQTRGRGFVDITSQVAAVVSSAGVCTGLCNAFLTHTSASLVIQENADPAVRRDLESFLERLVRDGDPAYTHTAEGPDDMPSHIRSALTATSISVPIADGRLGLGTWQAVYVWEHRTIGHRRRVVVTVLGTSDSSMQ